MTVARTVERIVKQRPFLEEALRQGIVNNAALAEQLIPQIETEERSKVKFSAVNMALRRLSERLSAHPLTRVKFETSDITIKSGLAVITAHNDAKTRKDLRVLYDMVDFARGDFITITQGVHEIMIITNDRYANRVVQSLKSSYRKMIRDVNSVTVRLPPKAVDTPGVLYILTRALVWADVNVIDVVSTFTELTYVVRDADATRTFEALKDVMQTYS